MHYANLHRVAFGNGHRVIGMMRGMVVGDQHQIHAGSAASWVSIQHIANSDIEELQVLLREHEFSMAWLQQE